MKRTSQRKRKARKNRRANPVVMGHTVKQQTSKTEASKEAEALAEVVNDWPLMVLVVLGMACVVAWLDEIVAGVNLLFGR